MLKGDAADVVDVENVDVVFGGENVVLCVVDVVRDVVVLDVDVEELREVDVGIFVNSMS